LISIDFLVQFLLSLSKFFELKSYIFQEKMKYHVKFHDIWKNQVQDIYTCSQAMFNLWKAVFSLFLMNKKWIHVSFIQFWGVFLLFYFCDVFLLFAFSINSNCWILYLVNLPNHNLIHFLVFRLDIFLYWIKPLAYLNFLAGRDFTYIIVMYIIRTNHRDEKLLP
jgi:hypothetical protein